MTFRRRGARQLTGSTAAPVIFPSSSRFTFRIFSVASIPLHDAIEEYVAIRKRKRVTEKKVTEIVDELRETGRGDCRRFVSQYFMLSTSVAPFRRTAWLSFTVLLALTRRRFFRSAGRRGADPKTAAVSIRHSLVRLDSAGQ
jgi:hypothetical protein